MVNPTINSGGVLVVDISSINLIGVLVAGIAAFVIGAVYYTVLSKPWMAAAKIPPGPVTLSASTLIITFVVELVMAFIMAALMSGVTMGEPVVAAGLFWAVLVWIGFAMPLLIASHRNQNFGWSLTIIDGVHWLLALLAIGAIIGWFGAPALEL